MTCILAAAASHAIVVGVELCNAERVFHRDGVHDVPRDQPVDDGRPFVCACVLEGAMACGVWRSEIHAADVA